MNANANTVNAEKYAWVDALLENCALQERLEQDRECDNQADADEANPEWNEDGAEEDPGNIYTDADLCAAYLDRLPDRAPVLTRQNACFLMEVVDELTGDISLVETDAYGRMEVDEPDEDMIADRSMESDGEDEDQALYNLKRYQELTFAPFKAQKICHEPMDICDSEEEDRDYMSENDKLEPRQLFNDDDEEEDKLSVMSDITVEPINDNECCCGHDCDPNDLCYDCIWLLEQEDRRRFPRRAVAAQAEDPHADVVFPVFDNEGDIIPIPMDIEEQEEQDEDEEQALNLGPAPNFQRQNTQWVHPETGQTVFNGNPDGSRT
jgi:hypothetical protein